MQNISVFVAALSVCVGALSGNFTYVPRDVLPLFQTEQERSIYVLDESKQPNILCSVYFRYAARNNYFSSPVSLPRFVYDEAEARTHYPNARDIAEEVARFIADHVTVDKNRGCSLSTSRAPYLQSKQFQKVLPRFLYRGIKRKQDRIFLKKEREHGNLFDRFLIAEEYKT
ncbi:MAG: uncharacterized protein A8A55_3145 [Amphiamblys sp. WSBS2006]|nr:MAG: uncharacterized protein A8A55_3145 [Amphiamblys sp. WSBS2006]